MKFLIHGSIAYDILVGYDGSFVDAIDPKALKNLSVSYVAPRMKRHHGGTAANIAWNIRLLGEEPLLTGTVGYDGGPYLALLEERGVNVTHIQKLDDHATATAIIGTDSEEHQITFFHPGADQHGTTPDIGEDRDDIACAIIAPRDALFMLKAAKQCADLAIPYLFDPGQQSHVFSTDEFRRAVSGSRGVVVNEYEWILASKKLGWSESQVIDACGLLIVTKGEKGLTIHGTEGSTDVRACKPDRTVNPTGAGDALRAGLLVGLGKKWPFVQAAGLGCALASFVVEVEGTLLDALDLDELKTRAKIAYGKELPRF